MAWVPWLPVQAQSVSQAKSGSGSTTSVATGSFASNVTAGSLLACFVFLQSTSATISSFSINGTAATAASGSPATTAVQRVYAGYVLSATGGSTTGCTATSSAGVAYSANAVEISLGAGCTTTHDIDNTGNAGSGTSATVPSTSPTAANAIGIAATGTNSNRGFTAGASYSIPTNGSVASTESSGLETNLAVSAATTAPMTITGGSTAWIDFLMLFNAPSCGGGGTTAVPQLMMMGVGP